jgi:hypothetical protein
VGGKFREGEGDIFALSDPGGQSRVIGGGKARDGGGGATDAPFDGGASDGCVIASTTIVAGVKSM